MCRSLTTHNRWKLILWWKICFTEPGSRAFSDLAPNTLLIQKNDGWCGKKIWNLFDRSSWIPWFPNSTICFAKKTSDTSMSTLARKEASQPWEQERVGVLGWRWKPISLEHTKTSATHKSSLYIFRGWLAMAHGWFRISWLPSVVCLSSQASVEFDFVQHEAPFDHWDG